MHKKFKQIFVLIWTFYLNFYILIVVVSDLKLGKGFKSNPYFFKKFNIQTTTRFEKLLIFYYKKESLMIFRQIIYITKFLFTGKLVTYLNIMNYQYFGI